MRNYTAGTNTLRMVFAVFLLAALASSAHAASEYRPPERVPPTGIGFRGDGSGYFPDAKIPVEFGDEKDLLWKVPLVNWSNSSPVPVGNRVLVMAEPTWSGATWPQLTCFDADTGKLLWVSDVNPLDAFPDMPAETREAITADFKWYYEVHNAIHTLCRPHARAGGLKAGDARLDELNAGIQKYGVAVKAVPGGDSGYFGRGHALWDMSGGFAARWQEMQQRISPYNLFHSWIEFGVTDRSGVALPTLAIDDEQDHVFGVGNADGGVPRWSLSLALLDDELVVKPRWIQQGKSQGSSPVFGNGRLFLSRFQVDPATGKEVGGKFRKLKSGREKWEFPQTSPENRHTLLATASHVYGCIATKGPKKGASAEDYTPQGIIQVFTHAGEKAAENSLSRGPLSPEHEARMVEQGRRLALWGYANAMNIGGDRLYIKSQDFLFCIGRE